MSNNICDCQSDAQTIDDALNNIHEDAIKGKVSCAHTKLATAYFEFLIAHMREGQNSQTDGAIVGMTSVVAMQKIAQKTIEQFILKAPYIYDQVTVIVKESEDDKSGK